MPHFHTVIAAEQSSAALSCSNSCKSFSIHHIWHKDF